MQFVKDGPVVPEKLLQAHEDGRVVFFCGAGISYRADLGNFEWLVQQAYAKLGRIPSAIEQSAITRGQFDSAIGLLEQGYPGGRIAVRQAIAKLLSPNLTKPNAMATHRALLTLAKNRDGRHRLITTNFDCLFTKTIEADSLKMDSYKAPLVPIPKNRWDGLVYLHGLLPDNPTDFELQRLVISSGDFGLAYLTERWAARFVTELFRNYSVCFVGYSINDPILRYMMDALAADRQLGESGPETFAFASYEMGQERETEKEWKAKNVTPILYWNFNHHSLFHDTLSAWSDMYRDGVLGKERVIDQYAMARPQLSTADDDFVGRMLWALSDRRAIPAKRFAEFNPLPTLDWLEPFTEARFRFDDLVRFGVSPEPKRDDSLNFSLLIRYTPYSLAPTMAPMRVSYALSPGWDDIMMHLSRWLVKHLNNPKLILWVAKHSGVLHPKFASIIDSELNSRPPSNAMLILWRIALRGKLNSHHEFLGFYAWQESLRVAGLTPSLRIQLRELLAPRVRLRAPFHILEGERIEHSDREQKPGDLVRWQIVLGVEHVHHAIRELEEDPEWRNGLPELLADATLLLRDALDLMRELEGVSDKSDLSYIHQPSIPEHPQNQAFEEWTALVEFARDAWLAMAAKSHETARLGVEVWRKIRYPIFVRLVFFAATDRTIFDPKTTISWLLEDDCWWLWSVEVQRETIRLLVAIGPYLESEDARRIETMILQGPPREMFRSDLEPTEFQRIVDREIWLRLAKLNDAGANLEQVALDRLRILSEQYPLWRLAHDERDEFPFWMSNDPDDARPRSVVPRRRREMEVWLREHQISNTWQEDDWQARCASNFPATACALYSLSKSNFWPAARWREALEAWKEERLAAHAWKYLAYHLLAAPDELICEVGHALIRWTDEIAKRRNGSDDSRRFAFLRRVIEVHQSTTALSSNDPITAAINHPVGMATESLLRICFGLGLQDGQKIPEQFNQIFTIICDPVIAIYIHGRVLLATYAISLFRIDQEWTKQHLLSRFSWRLSVIEATAAWQGFLWAPRLHRPTLEALKADFIETSRHYTALGRCGEQYAALLMYVGLEAPELLTPSELVDAMLAMPQEGLEAFASALLRSLEGAGDQAGNYWRNRVRPFLLSGWPQSASVNTLSISADFAALSLAANDAFPEALELLGNWLRPIERPESIVRAMHEKDYCQRFPDSALRFLSAIIGDGPQFLPKRLRPCIDAIQNSAPELAQDIRFIRLRDYLRSRE